MIFIVQVDKSTHTIDVREKIERPACSAALIQV